MPNIAALIVVATVMFCVLGGVTLLAHIYNLNNIKSKTVGDGQHGTARFSTKAEIRRIYKQVPFTPEEWRKKAKKNTPPDLPQGIIVGYRNKGGNTTAYVDDADVHCMMVGAPESAVMTTARRRLEPPVMSGTETAMPSGMLCRPMMTAMISPEPPSGPAARLPA